MARTEKAKRHQKSRERKKLSRLQRFRKKYRDKAVTWSLMVTNQPMKSWLWQDAAQAKWSLRQMERIDVMSIAECGRGLEAKIAADRRTTVIAAPKNDGANGNVIVSTDRDPKRGHFYTDFVANSGQKINLHQAKATLTKKGSRLGVLAVHLPSEGHYKSSAGDKARAHVCHQIARQAKVMDVRSVVALGDWNWSWVEVLRELRKVDERWVHLGSVERGVDHAFGLNVTSLAGELYRKNYSGGVSDHPAAVVAKIGVMK